MHLQRRLNRLERKRGGDVAGPDMVLICDGITAESGGAIFRGGGCIVRDAGEAAAAFMQRATVAQSRG